MEQEIACPGSNGDVVLRAESIPFSQVPGQSRLFLAYQSDPLSLTKYYPSAVVSHTQISERIPEVLSNYTTDRTALCDALEETNRQIGAGQKVFEHISLLHEPDAVAVVTGQQTGLFTGPLYTIYKALSAARAAECLRGRGFKAVPVFWAATEDHDFAEVNEAFLVDADGELTRIATDLISNGQPVGAIALDPSINATVDSLFGAVRATEFTPDLKTLVSDAWQAGSTFSEAFERMLATLTSEFGLIVIDPLHPTMKRLAAPICADATRKAKEIADALFVRSHELTVDGFEPQVAIEAGYFPMFWQAGDGTRVAIRQTEDGTFRTKDKAREFSVDGLTHSIEDDPTRFSPGVMLRPVVQDFILPTVCYFGGGGEIAYFAQNSEVYRVLRRPVTTILHRQSFTVVEAKHQRTLKRYGLEFTDIFRGFGALLPEIVDRYLNKDLATTFAEVEEKINTELNRLDRELSHLDPTLAENLANRRRKIIYHLGALRGKAQRASLQKDEMVNRQLTAIFNELMPHGGLQERTLNVTYFLDQYGPRFIDWIYRAIDLNDNGHRVVYL
jgi:bacillithiol synthase